MVDEINQGMDPINERHIFNLIVKSAYEGAQYFLLSPKVSTLHIIYSIGHACIMTKDVITTCHLFLVLIVYLFVCLFVYLFSINFILSWSPFSNQPLIDCIILVYMYLLLKLNNYLIRNFVLSGKFMITEDPITINIYDVAFSKLQNYFM